MHRIARFSEQTQNLLEEVELLRFLGKREEALQRYDQIIHSNTGLTHEEREEFLIGRQLLVRELSSTYWPQPLDHNRDILPLVMKSRYYRNTGDHEQALRYMWAYFQFCSAGTWSFQSTLANLTECAANYGDWNLARHLADMCLSHYRMLQAAGDHEVTPVGISSPAVQHEWPDEEGLLPLYLPYRTALKGILRSDNSCWVRILELQVEITLPTEYDESDFQQMIQVLHNIYTNNRDSDKLKWLEQFKQDSL